ncbi:unnamed protein product, partial [Gongylonema pulchrum]|uniref:Neurofibromin n=1 Tax=Gongylonema pulchrum TaxID=637853 RepID=A0A183DA47_9BILA
SSTVSLIPDGEKDVKWDSFPSALFHVHEWIVDSCELMAHFISFFQDAADDNNTRLRICQAVGFWIRACPTHFDAPLCRLVDRLKVLALSKNTPDAAALLDLSAM